LQQKRDQIFIGFKCAFSVYFYVLLDVEVIA